MARRLAMDDCGADLIASLNTECTEEGQSTPRKPEDYRRGAENAEKGRRSGCVFLCVGAPGPGTITPIVALWSGAKSVRIKRGAGKHETPHRSPCVGCNRGPLSADSFPLFSYKLFFSSAALQRHCCNTAQKAADCDECYGFSAGTTESVERNRRGASGITPGLHQGESEPRHPAAGHPDGDGDGARVAIRRRRRVLGRSCGIERGGDGGPDRVAAHAGVCGGHGAQSFDDRHGGAAYRRERPGRRGRGSRAGDFPGAHGVVADRGARLHLCARTSAPDGRIACDYRDGQLVCADRAGRRKRRRRLALSEQRDLSWRGRRGDRDAAAVGLEHHQPRARPVLDFRAGTISAPRRDGRGACDVHGPEHRRALSVLPADARHGAHSRAWHGRSA